jgi:hypothetical protein
LTIQEALESLALGVVVFAVDFALLKRLAIVLYFLSVLFNLILQR